MGTAVIIKYFSNGQAVAMSQDVYNAVTLRFSRAPSLSHSMFQYSLLQDIYIHHSFRRIRMKNRSPAIIAIFTLRTSHI